MVKREVIVKKEAPLEVFIKGSYEVTFINRESAVKFASSQDVKFGERVLSKQLLHSCNKCSRRFVFRHQLKKHIGRLHVKRFQCHECPKKFLRKDHFENHLLSKHSISDHVCVTCNKKYKNELTLLKHSEFFCSLQCKPCMRTFTKKCDIEKHRKICFPIDDYGGGICG